MRDDGRYYICFHISDRIRIISTISDKIRLAIDIINIRFKYSDTDTVSNVKGVFGIALLLVFYSAPRFLAKQFQLQALSSRKNGGVVRAPKELLHEL